MVQSQSCPRALKGHSGASVPFTIFSVGCVLQSFSSPHNTEGHLGQESGSNEFTFRGSSYLGP